MPSSNSIVCLLSILPLGGLLRGEDRKSVRLASTSAVPDPYLTTGINIVTPLSGIDNNLRPSVEFTGTETTPWPTVNHGMASQSARSPGEGITSVSVASTEEYSGSRRMTDEDDSTVGRLSQDGNGSYVSSTKRPQEITMAGTKYPLSTELLSDASSTVKVLTSIASIITDDVRYSGRYEKMASLSGYEETRRRLTEAIQSSSWSETRNPTTSNIGIVISFRKKVPTMGYSIPSKNQWGESKESSEQVDNRESVFRPKEDQEESLLENENYKKELAEAHLTSNVRRFKVSDRLYNSRSSITSAVPRLPYFEESAGREMSAKRSRFVSPAEGSRSSPKFDEKLLFRMAGNGRMSDGNSADKLEFHSYDRPL
ncbi:hypothetical protein KM043_007007 [Ampulex compressa]|nr:hypothetical protein KM043_007007 [Ampulex compressa]